MINNALNIQNQLEAIDQACLSNQSYYFIKEGEGQELTVKAVSRFNLLKRVYYFFKGESVETYLFKQIVPFIEKLPQSNLIEFRKTYHHVIYGLVKQTDKRTQIRAWYSPLAILMDHFTLCTRPVEKNLDKFLRNIDSSSNEIYLEEKEIKKLVNIKYTLSLMVYNESLELDRKMIYSEFIKLQIIYERLQAIEAKSDNGTNNKAQEILKALDLTPAKLDALKDNIKAKMDLNSAEVQEIEAILVVKNQNHF